MPAPVDGQRVEQRGDQHGGGQVGAQPVPLEAAGRRDGGAVEARAALQGRYTFCSLSSEHQGNFELK